MGSWGWGGSGSKKLQKEYESKHGLKAGWTGSQTPSGVWARPPPPNPLGMSQKNLMEETAFATLILLHAGPSDAPGLVSMLPAVGLPVSSPTPAFTLGLGRGATAGWGPGGWAGGQRAEGRGLLALSTRLPDVPSAQ